LNIACNSILADNTISNYMAWSNRNHKSKRIRTEKKSGDNKSWSEWNVVSNK